MISRRLVVTMTASIALATSLATTAVKAEPWRIAYLSPSFDTSDAWERNFWAIQGRLDELGIEYEMQALAVSSLSLIHI